MRHSRKKSHSNLHSENRHRNRNYKRRVRNLFLEIIFIIMLIFVANKCIKEDEEKVTVTQLSVETQKQQIEEELKKNDLNNLKPKESNNIIEVEVPENDNLGFQIIKVNITYTEGKSIVDFTVRNSTQETTTTRFYIGFLDKDQKIIETTYVDVPILESQQQTKVNIVIDKDLTGAKKIKSLKEE